MKQTPIPAKFTLLKTLLVFHCDYVKKERRGLRRSKTTASRRQLMSEGRERHQINAEKCRLGEKTTLQPCQSSRPHAWSEEKKKKKAELLLKKVAKSVGSQARDDEDVPHFSCFKGGVENINNLCLLTYVDVCSHYRFLLSGATSSVLKCSRHSITYNTKEKMRLLLKHNV